MQRRQRRNGPIRRYTRRQKVSTRPKRVARNPMVRFTRTFRTQRKLVLDNVTNGDTFGQDNLILNLTGFPGFNTVATSFDHYRVTRIRVFMRHAYPTNATANNGQLPRNAACSTIFWSAVDYSLLTTASPNTANSIRNVQNSRSFLVPSNQQVKVADFRPRVTSRFTSTAGTDVIRPVSTWCPTNSLVTWSGLRVYVENAGGQQLFPSPAVQQQIVLSFSVDVQFRQPQLANTTTLALPNANALPDFCAREDLGLELSSDSEDEDIIDPDTNKSQGIMPEPVRTDTSQILF